MEDLLPFEALKREILVRKDAETNPEYGSNPEKRQIERLIEYGVVCLNKPTGPTSHQVADYVKKILNLEKVGHGGTLDPGVSGVLPIALERGTRIVQALLPAGKEYVCVMHLHKEIQEEDIKKTANKFIGEITQLPPVRSAVKRQNRQRNIYYFSLLEINGQDVLFKLGCQGGTYVRKICHDFGLALGTNAHMAELIRTKAGPFSYKNWVTLHDLKDAYDTWKENNDESLLRKIIMPIESSLTHLPKVWVFDNAVDTLCHGAALSLPGIVKLESGINVNDTVAVMSLKNELVCLGNAKMDSEAMKFGQKGVAISGMKVFMLPDTYPKFKKVVINGNN